MTYKVTTFAIIPLLLPRMGPSVTDRISGAALGIVAAIDARASERIRRGCALVPSKHPPRFLTRRSIYDRLEDSAALCTALRISTFGPWCNR